MHLLNANTDSIKSSALQET